MTPQQALSIIEQVRRQVNLPGTAHDQLREAIRVLAEAVAPPVPKA